MKSTKLTVRHAENAVRKQSNIQKTHFFVFVYFFILEMLTL